VAVGMLAGAIGIGYVGFARSPSMRVPPAIAYLLALICIVTAARLFEMASGRPGRGDWFATVFFGASAVIEWWIALFASPGQCRSSVGGLSFSSSGSVGACRIGFGIAAGICTALAISCLVRILRPRRVLPQ
ncbi:MAG TPA: hypothetical protein VF387_07190, partial [Gemmatimonadaceae bacterium]